MSYSHLINDTDSYNQRITGNYWSQVSSSIAQSPMKWGHILDIKKHLSSLYSSTRTDKLVEAEYDYIINESGRTKFQRAISVGCGEASKELWMLKTNAVAHFDLFDLSEKRVEICGEKLKKNNLLPRANIHASDAMKEESRENQYDLVFWNSSLHHMSSISEAMDWSKNILCPGGVIFF